MTTKLKKILLWVTVTVFYLLTPLCIMGVLGTGVSLKYEVDQARIFVEINDKTTIAEKEQAQKEIDKQERELKRTLYFWNIGLFAFPISATTLLIFRKRLTTQTT